MKKSKKKRWVKPAMVVMVRELEANLSLDSCKVGVINGDPSYISRSLYAAPDVWDMV